MNLTITKRDGSREPFNADRINRAIERACYGLTNPIAKITQIASETQLTLYDGITSTELDEAIVNTAAQNIQEDTEFDRVAARLLLKTIYKKVLGRYETPEELRDLHRQHFLSYIDKGIEAKILDPRMKELFDLDVLADQIDTDRDEFLTYIGLKTMSKRYMLRDKDHNLIEVPQFMWMRIAMGLSLTEKNPTEIAKKFYAKASALEYIAGGSTNISAGTIFPCMSNCYLMDMEDNIGHIGKTVADIMLLSKATGGIGLAVTKLRANGSPIATNNTFSSGPVPFLHIIDSTIRAISRAGKKMGALCFYMENWHIDFGEFLDLKQNAGDDYRRTRTANTAVYISDEFMKRVKTQDWWYLFDPKDTPLLIESYGAEFSKNYDDYIAMAERGEIKRFKKIKADEQFRAIIVSLQTTSHPWLTWKDTINVRALNNNTGVIHCSNLCTEITLPQDKNNVAVCNLLSINLARHVRDGRIDWKRLGESARLGLRQLDNLLDINHLPIAEADNSDKANRAIGMGIIGFSDTLEQLGFPYDSQETYNLMDRVAEFISYMAIDESANLAQEKGAYANFSGSGWSKGYLPIDTIKHLEENRGEAVTVEQDIYSLELDWSKLREKVTQGMRNATVLAIAPTANIGVVSGTSTGIDPRFAQMFSRSGHAGKHLEINFNLVQDLKRLGLWEKTKTEILSNYGDLTNIEGIPEHLKKVYKISFAIPPEAFIEVAARAQKWVDQAISRNMYLETRDTEEIMKVYIKAWEKGLKTTYYLHMKPRHNAEQSTVKINKAQGIGKRGFGVLFSEPVTKDVLSVEIPVQVPVEIPAQPTFSAPLTEAIGFQTSEPVAEEKTQAPTFTSSPHFSNTPVMTSPSAASTETTTNKIGKACPIDPMERLMCDSCQ